MKIWGQKWAGRALQSMMQGLEVCQRPEPLSQVSSLDGTHYREKCDLKSNCFYLYNLLIYYIFKMHVFEICIAKVVTFIIFKMY